MVFKEFFLKEMGRLWKYLESSNCESGIRVIFDRYIFILKLIKFDTLNMYNFLYVNNTLNMYNLLYVNNTFLINQLQLGTCHIIY